MLSEAPPKLENKVGTHASRTMMLEEISLLFEAVPQTANLIDYAQAVVEDNVLHKRTASTRNKSLRHLRELYTLEPSFPLFRPLRVLWEADVLARPLLALLTALLRDDLLYATHSVILALPEGAEVSASDLSSAVGKAYPDRLTPSIRDKVGRNTASSWTQSGHLGGHSRKHRIKVQPTAAAVAYAMYIGHLQGLRGIRLFDSVWAKVLDSSPHQLDTLAFAASQQGWLEYRRLAEVADFSFRHFDSLAGGDHVPNRDVAG